MILNDKQIKKLSEKEEMITPFVAESVSKGISHGLNSFGYDLRCGAEFKIFTNIKGATAISVCEFGWKCTDNKAPKQNMLCGWLVIK